MYSMEERNLCAAYMTYMQQGRPHDDYGLGLTATGGCDGTNVTLALWSVYMTSATVEFRVSVDVADDEYPAASFYTVEANGCVECSENGTDGRKRLEDYGDKFMASLVEFLQWFAGLVRSVQRQKQGDECV